MVKLFVLLISFLSSVFAGEDFSNLQRQYLLKKRKVPQSLTTSVIIPCHYGHFKHLFALLEIHTQQSVIPDEIIISLSESEKIPIEEINALKDYPWPFKFTLICTNEKKTAGENRNIALESASGPLLLFFDADDVPHPQRTEIIKEIFEEYEVNFLFHCFTYEEAFPNPRMKKAYYLSKMSQCLVNFTLGHVCYLKEPLQALKWPIDQRQEDIVFAQKVFQEVNRIGCLLLPLTHYRVENSTSSFTETNQ